MTYRQRRYVVFVILTISYAVLAFGFYQDWQRVIALQRQMDSTVGQFSDSLYKEIYRANPHASPLSILAPTFLVWPIPAVVFGIYLYFARKRSLVQ